VSIDPYANPDTIHGELGEPSDHEAERDHEDWETFQRLGPPVKWKPAVPVHDVRDVPPR
jgi:hypothetical protein